jgi:hypothetical protein
MEIPPFPEAGEKDGGLEEVSLEELLLNRRGIAGGNSGRFRLGYFFFSRQDRETLCVRRVQIDEFKAGTTGGS